MLRSFTISWNGLLCNCTFSRTYILNLRMRVRISSTSFRHAGFEYKLKPAMGGKQSIRIANAVDNMFTDGIRKVVYLDIDAALVSLQTMKRAYDFLSLDDDVVVLAPDQVDQLYLVGLKKPHTEIFDALNAKDQFEVAIKISSPLSAMMFTLERFNCARDLAGLRKVFSSFRAKWTFSGTRPSHHRFLERLEREIRLDLIATPPAAGNILNGKLPKRGRRNFR